MTDSRLVRAALLAVALLAATVGLTGCLGSGPDVQAQAMLSSALDELTDRSVLRYRGALPGSKPATRIDAHVTRSGIALGTVQLGSARLRVLAVDGKQFVRGDADFWSRNGVFQPSLARTYARRWVQIGPHSVRGFPPLRTPAQLAAWLRKTADPDAARASDEKVSGTPAKRIEIGGGGAVYVSAAKPHRVVRVQAPERPAAGTKTAAILVGLSVARAAEGSEPGAEGIDISQPDAEEYDALVEDVKDEARKLHTAVDSQIQFTNTPAFSCSRGGTCTASTTVSNVVTAEGKATGTLDVTLTASITARGQMQVCRDSRAMAPNSSASLSCNATFSLPPSNTSYVIPVVGSLYTTARSNVSVERLVKDLERDRPTGEGPARRFVTTPRGTTFDIPAGWVSRTADNGRGIVFQRPGATGNADSIRISEPSALYPGGSFRYYNRFGQPLDRNGKPGKPDETHFPEEFLGQLPGWPTR